MYSCIGVVQKHGKIKKETNIISENTIMQASCSSKKNCARQASSCKTVHAKSCCYNTLLGRLCVRDLVDEQAYTTLGDDVGNAIANLNGHH